MSAARTELASLGAAVERHVAAVEATFGDSATAGAAEPPRKRAASRQSGTETRTAATLRADAHRLRARIQNLEERYKRLERESEARIATAIAELAKCATWNVNYASESPLITTPLEVVHAAAPQALSAQQVADAAADAR